MREPYQKLNLTNKRGLGGMAKPNGSSVSPKDTSRSGNTVQGFQTNNNQSSGDFDLSFMD